MSDAGVPVPQRHRVRAHFDRAARRYESQAVLQREVRDRLHQRLTYFRLAPSRILDLGAGPAASAPALSARYPKAELVALDLSLAMLAQAPSPRWPWRRRRAVAVCGDMHALPLADASIDLIVSSLALQWSGDPEPVFAECARVLRPGGLLLFSSLGPDTLQELKAALGPNAPVNTFLDMHDVGDAMVRAGLGAPVLDVEHLTLCYEQARSVMRDLKAIGASYAGPPRHSGLRGRAWLATVEARYEAFRHEGRLPATFEVVYGHGFRPERDDRPQDGTTVPGGAVAHFPVDRIVKRG
mgnify:CR=1 FL=1